MKRHSMLLVTILLASCSYLSPKEQKSQEQGDAPAVTSLSTRVDFPADQGWENPYPGVYIREEYDSSGTKTGEHISLVGADAHVWASENIYRKRIAELTQKLSNQKKSSQVDPIVEADLEYYKSQYQVAQQRVNEVHQEKVAPTEVAPSNIEPQTLCYATARATASGYTSGYGAKAYGTARACPSTVNKTYSSNTSAVAFTANSQAPSDYDTGAGGQSISSSASVGSSTSTGCTSRGTASAGGDVPASDSLSNSSCVSTTN